MKRSVSTSKAPGAIGPYSQAVEINGLIFTSGQLGIDPETGTLPDCVKKQTAQSLKNIKAILNQAGLDLEDIIKTTVFVKNMGDFAKINEVYSEFICSDPLPARSCVEVAALPKGGLVEIEAIALKK